MSSVGQPRVGGLRDACRRILEIHMVAPGLGFGGFHDHLLDI